MIRIKKEVAEARREAENARRESILARKEVAEARREVAEVKKIIERPEARRRGEAELISSRISVRKKPRKGSIKIRPKRAVKELKGPKKTKIKEKNQRGTERPKIQEMKKESREEGERK